MAIVISNNQFALYTLMKKKGGLTLSYWLHLSQVTAGSLLKQKVIQWDNNWGENGGFVFTEYGLTRLEEFGEANINRKGFTRPLSSAIKDRSVIHQYETLLPTLKESYQRGEERAERQRRHAERVAGTRRKNLTVLKKGAA